MRTKQAPVRSGYGPQTTAREVLGERRLDGTIAIVTGGYVGVGLETTRALAAAGATVIAPARTPDKARGALSKIEGVELESVDLFDPASVEGLAARFPRIRSSTARSREQTRASWRHRCSVIPAASSPSSRRTILPSARVAQTLSLWLEASVEA